MDLKTSCGWFKPNGNLLKNVSLGSFKKYVTQDRGTGIHKKVTESDMRGVWGRVQPKK